MNDGILASHVDETFPTITVEMARIVFDAIDPTDLHGFERAHYAKVAAALPLAGQEDADQAWRAVTTVVNYLDIHALSRVHRRIPRDEAANGADYAFTWGVYHDRVEFCEHEGVDVQTFEPLAGYEPAINGPPELEAYNALAEELSVEPAPMADPDHWRRYRLAARVWGALENKTNAERAALKIRLADRDLSPPALEAALANIDAASGSDR